GPVTQWTDYLLNLTKNEILLGYPRPQMKRQKWTNLYVLWSFPMTYRNMTIKNRTINLKIIFNETIRVPFPVESYLSGIHRRVLPAHYLRYQRRLQISRDRLGKFNRLLLHFDSVDYETYVWINRIFVESIVRVWDLADKSYQSRSKQILNSSTNSIYYTLISGIWQTVWLESVLLVYISKLWFQSTIDHKNMCILHHRIDINKNRKLEKFVTHIPPSFTIYLFYNEFDDSSSSLNQLLDVERKNPEKKDSTVFRSSIKILKTTQYVIKLPLKLGQNIIIKKLNIVPNRSLKSKLQFEYELKSMIDTLYNYPSIVMWVMFNEEWSQYDILRLGQWLKYYSGEYRLINAVRGWHDRSVGDFRDIHDYTAQIELPSINTYDRTNRALVLGECGGYGLLVCRNHTWNFHDSEGWSYAKFKGKYLTTYGFERLMMQINSLKRHSYLSSMIYTQLSDVKYELNDILTYDRKVSKYVQNHIRNALKVNFTRYRDTDDLIALSIAAGKKHKSITERLANCEEVDINKPSSSGITPLLMVAEVGWPDILQILLKRVAIVDAAPSRPKAKVNKIAGSTPLIGAIEYDHPDCVKILLQNKANANHQNQSGISALMLAAD
ncbi:unnamed protein product, partial [Didymodactylos carnosus]